MLGGPNSRRKGTLPLRKSTLSNPKRSRRDILEYVTVGHVEVPQPFHPNHQLDIKNAYSIQQDQSLHNSYIDISILNAYLSYAPEKGKLLDFLFKDDELEIAIQIETNVQKAKTETEPAEVVRAVCSRFLNVKAGTSIGGSESLIFKNINVNHGVEFLFKITELDRNIIEADLLNELLNDAGNSGIDILASSVPYIQVISHFAKKLVSSFSLTDNDNDDRLWDFDLKLYAVNGIIRRKLRQGMYVLLGDEGDEDETSFDDLVLKNFKLYKRTEDNNIRMFEANYIVIGVTRSIIEDVKPSQHTQ